MKASSPLSGTVLLSAALLACGRVAEPGATPGAPLPDLTAAELARFRAGALLFDRVFTPEQGLGPLFNENQCSACHTSPAAGGTGDQLLVKATRFTPPDRCNTLAHEGGENVRARATSRLRAHGMDHQPFPSSATERGEFTPTSLFGFGLLERVPGVEILSRADPDDRDGDGISGRPGRDTRGRLGRFGRKAELATLADFVETALRFEMGLTTPRHPEEIGPAGVPYPPGVDPAPDPEVSDPEVRLLVEFVRFLAPPTRRAPQNAADQRFIERGETAFNATGCAACHVPRMTTGRTASAALSRKRVYLYSDLLLHDLGPELANVCGIAATPAELRTAPLLGLRHRKQLLHDGRAHTPIEAIQFHGGEAAPARARFRQLPELDQHALLRFLGTL